MIIFTGYILIIFFLLLFLIILTIHTLFLLYSSFSGSCYVATKQKELEFILAQIRPKKGKIFLELGCGDGRVVREAIRKYGVKGIGIDINPLLILYAKIISKIQKISCIFKIKNMLESTTDLKNADYIYLFLMPDLIKKLIPLFQTKAKKGVIIISHGFKLPNWEKLLIKYIDHKPFPTFIYRLP